MQYYAAQIQNHNENNNNNNNNYSFNNISNGLFDYYNLNIPSEEEHQEQHIQVIEDESKLSYQIKLEQEKQLLQQIKQLIINKNDIQIRFSTIF